MAGAYRRRILAEAAKRMPGVATRTARIRKRKGWAMMRAKRAIVRKRKARPVGPGQD